MICSGVFLVDIVLFIEPVHEKSIDENNDYKSIDSALLCEPESELKAPNLNGIQIPSKQYSATKRNRKPEKKQYGQIDQICLPVFSQIFHARQ
jgi:hypothetical protein